jgi:hypothetical protein
MICIPCRKAADAGRYGIEAHFDAGCRSIERLDVITIKGKRERPLVAARIRGCDCQHKESNE